MANEVTSRSVVLEYGNVGLNWIVLRNGHFPTYSICDHDVRSSPRIVAISKSIRGRGIL